MSLQKFPGMTGFLCLKEEVFAIKNRMRQRANRKLKREEELLDRKNAHGVKDLTAYNAVKQIVSQGKAALVLR